MSILVDAMKQKMFREEAQKLALKKNDWLWKIVFSGKRLAKLRLIYFEYIILTVEVTITPSFIKQKLFNQKESTTKRIQIIVNGSTGSVALVMDKQLEIETKELESEDDLQRASFDYDEAEKRAKKLAHKITHRAIGGFHETQIVEEKRIYRPFWVAFYGDYKEGSKVHYITIPADGGNNKRAR